MPSFGRRSRGSPLCSRRDTRRTHHQTARDRGLSAELSASCLERATARPETAKGAGRPRALRLPRYVSRRPVSRGHTYVSLRWPPPPSSPATRFRTAGRPMRTKGWTRHRGWGATQPTLLICFRGHDRRGGTWRPEPRQGPLIRRIGRDRLSGLPPAPSLMRLRHARAGRAFGMPGHAVPMTRPDEGCREGQEL